jgi:hypothetical protein
MALVQRSNVGEYAFMSGLGVCVGVGFVVAAVPVLQGFDAAARVMCSAGDGLDEGGGRDCGKNRMVVGLGRLVIRGPRRCRRGAMVSSRRMHS